MQSIPNPFRGVGLPETGALAEGDISLDPEPVRRLLARCPAAAETPLRPLSGLAARLGIAKLWAKDETARMGLGSFKALGAAYAIAHQAAERVGESATEAAFGRALAGETFVAASAGNHGLSVAAGARLFGARAVIYLGESVPEAFAARLRGKGAEVVRAGKTYEASMAAAAAAADARGWQLLSDSSWPGYSAPARDVMAGYLAMAAEVTDAFPDPAARPSHVFLQAGVGGLAAAVAGYLRARWGEAPVIVVVEPEAAPALKESVRAGRPVRTDGPVSAMGRLDCKEPSHLALKALARDADHFATVSETEAADAVAALADEGVATTPSGAAGLAALATEGAAKAFEVDTTSRALIFVSEGAEG